jgi:GTP pyrophosphokinase
MPYSVLFGDAFNFANKLHALQHREGTAIPYITHRIAVAALVAEYEGDEEQVIAALLHDAVKDQGGQPTLEKIKRKFGPRVAKIIEGCTDASHLEELNPDVEMDPDVLLVSAADKLHNARMILANLRKGIPVSQQFMGTREETLSRYRALANAFLSEQADHPLFQELDRTVREIECIATATENAAMIRRTLDSMLGELSDVEFVTIQHDSGKFVHFGVDATEPEPLLLNLPSTPMSETETYRAVEYFKKHGVAGQRNWFDIEGKRTGPEVVVFSMSFHSVAEATQVVLEIFAEVYDLSPRNVELTVESC